MAELAGRRVLQGPTLDHVWIGAGLALLVLRPLLTAIPPHDFWWHLATGRLIVATGQIPVSDSFSYTQAGAAFYNQSWLAQLLMFGLYQAGGIELLILVQALLIAGAYGLVLWWCIVRSGDPRLGTLALLAAAVVSFDNWNVRPQSYAIPCFAAYLVILDAWRHDALPLWRLALLPAIMAPWVNLHGSFVLGLGLIVVFCGTEALRPGWLRDDPRARRRLVALALWGGLAAAATLLNPGGLAVLGYVRDLLSSSAVTRLVTEWSPPSVRDLFGAMFFAYLVGLAGVLALARTRPDPLELLRLVPFLWLALSAGRNVIWFAMLAAPLLAEHAAALRPAARARVQGNARLNLLLLGMLALPVMLALPWIKPGLGLPAAAGNLLAPDTPVAAVERLRALPPGERPTRLFHSEAFGSYLIWAAPEQPVFIDTRIELYPFDHWVNYIRLSQGVNSAALMAQYQIDGLLLNPVTQAGLLEAARHDPRWELRYADEASVLLTRTP